MILNKTFLTIIFLLSLDPFPVLSFNLDGGHPVIVSGPASQMFGYSLELRGGSEPSILVGDPLNDQEDESGAVYQCGIYLESSSGRCRRLYLSDEMTDKEIRTRQLLGLDLAISDTDLLHSCAPRRQVKIKKSWSTASGNVVAEYFAMQGKCWQYNLTSSEQTHGNYLNNSRKFYSDPDCPRGSSCRYGSLYSSLGMSLHASKDGTVLLGAPGTFTWEGTLAALR